jgi:hypothetical protein
LLDRTCTPDLLLPAERESDFEPDGIERKSGSCAVVWDELTEEGKEYDRTSAPQLSPELTHSGSSIEGLQSEDT